MSTPETIANLAQRNARNALQRIEVLEEQANRVQMGIQQLTGAVSNSIAQLQQQIQQLSEVVNALVAVVGPEQVTGQVVNERKSRVSAEAEQNKQQVAQLLEQGILVKVDKVSEKSLIIGKESKDGEVIFPGRQQVVYTRVMPDLKEKILNAEVGFKIDTPAGNTFEVTEIYDIVEKKAEEAVKAAEAAAGPAPEAPAVQEA